MDGIIWQFCYYTSIKIIEIYNYGSSPIDLSQETLQFNGFMTSDSFGKATSGSSCTIPYNQNNI